MCALAQVNLPTVPALPSELWLLILYGANKGGKFARRMATFDSALAEAARKHEDNRRRGAAAALDAKTRRELAPLMLQRKQADERAHQVQFDLYLCELDGLVKQVCLPEDIFGSDSSDSE